MKVNQGLETFVPFEEKINLYFPLPSSGRDGYSSISNLASVSIFIFHVLI
ncbi:hypothetical protein C2W64_03639 [Brevibacillus laterosporus]|nr:hypothetical protein C2W64_03639 [Brevibacillus laterosporus]